MSRNSTFFPVPARCRHERPATVGGRSRRTFTEGVSRVVATASPLEAELAEPIRAKHRLGVPTGPCVASKALRL